MEKARFLEAKKQHDIIECCNEILARYEVEKNYEELGFVIFAIERILDIDKQIQRSFIRWVQNEKEIAEQKLKEI